MTELQKKIIPVSVGDIRELTVTGMAASGDGVLSLNGYTIFIPGCVTGDRLIGRVVKTTPGFGVCTAEKILFPSSIRSEPFCRYYKDCGGCQLQHINYHEQLNFKRGVVRDALERIGGVTLPCDIGIMPCSAPYSYRSRGIFAVGRSDGNIKIGFYKKKSHKIIDIENCPVLLKPVNRILEGLRTIIQKEEIPIYDEEMHKGVLRRVIIRGSMSKNEFMVGLVTNRGRIQGSVIERFTELKSELSGKIWITGLVQNINTQKNNIILGKKCRTLWGSPVFSDRIGEIDYRLSLTSFFQVNPIQMEVLNRTVFDFLGSTCDKVLDAYCGNGSISLWLAREGITVTGVEENENAISDALKSTKKNNLGNCSFICSTVEKFLDSKKESNYQTFILNPPRGGCSESVLDSVIRSCPEKIVYVSCKPSTLARDLKKLRGSGYQLKKISVIDMFPQTVHMETVVLLKRD